MQCMLNLWNKQNMQNMQNVPMGMANPAPLTASWGGFSCGSLEPRCRGKCWQVQSFTSMGNMPNGFNGFAVGPFPNVWTGDFQQVQGFQGMQVGFQAPCRPFLSVVFYLRCGRVDPKLQVVWNFGDEF